MLWCIERSGRASPWYLVIISACSLKVGALAYGTVHGVGDALVLQSLCRIDDRQRSSATTWLIHVVRYVELCSTFPERRFGGDYLFVVLTSPFDVKAPCRRA